MLQDRSIYQGKTLLEVWAAVRRTLSLILKYLGADGQARIATFFKLIDVRDVENLSLFLDRDVFRGLLVNRPDIVLHLFTRYTHLIAVLTGALLG